MFYLDEVIENEKMYSVKQLNKLLFDVDDNLTSNIYFKNRNLYKIKSGKHQGYTYYMLIILEIKKILFIMDKMNEGVHKEFLEFCLKRRRLNKIILSRLEEKRF